MAVDVLHIVDVIEVMENFLARARPPEEMRDELDLGYKIEDQSVIIHEIRPHPGDASKKIEPFVAKATYVKKSDSWKIFWIRADLKWYPFAPKPMVSTLSEFISVVEADTHGCFWG